MTALLDSLVAKTPEKLRFLELEITKRCQLTCGEHCFVQAGPTQGHGTMSTDDWKRVISEAAALGTETIQLIGGEPTLHPDFAELVNHSLAEGLKVIVYSNLYRVRDAHWPLFERPGVSLATSYYADTDAGHDQVTGRRGSHAATRANIIEAQRRGIHVRVGIVDVLEGQRVAEARAELMTLGITDIHTDRVRAIGNAAKAPPCRPPPNCAGAAPTAWPQSCPTARSLPASWADSCPPARCKAIRCRRC
ncbi:radical SAM protein [Streptomyces noursei]|uniref:radical SAM protein n=1 Tax=Streptomyces noursei TaxID=1971 RepID=UPI0027E38937|nr:radical SAM protein [Streptomyces noursei]